MTATNVNWRKVQAAYRAGVITITEIARQAGVHESTIRDRAKRYGWKRDLTARVRARTSQKLVLALASPESTKSLRAGEQPTEAEDEATVEQAALTQLAVVREHSMAIRNGLDLMGRLMRELDVVTSKGDEIAAAIDASETDEKKRFAAHRAVSLPARAAVMRDLTQAARLWIQLERQAFRISDDRDRNTASAIEEMTEEELEASLREDMKILNLWPNPEPEKPKRVAPKGSRDK